MQFHEVANFFPLMQGREYEALKADIAANGLREAMWTYQGKIIDGRNRFRVCQETGMPARFREWDGNGSLVAFVVSLNLHRRHLTDSQRAMIADHLATLGNGHRASEISEGAFTQPDAARLLQVSVDSIGFARTVHQQGAPELVQAVEQGQVSVSAAALIAQDPPERQRELIRSDDHAAVLRRAREIKSQRRQKRLAERAREKALANEQDHPLAGKAWQVMCRDLCDCVDNQLAIPKSADAIITDPPYGSDFLPLYKSLGRFAGRILKPGGHCLVMVGQTHLQETIGLLKETLDYQWTLAYLTPGKSTQIYGKRVKCNWKPVLWFTKGPNCWEFIGDTLTSNRHDKRFQEWGQSESGMAQMVEQFTVPNDLVVDPFCGAGTTGVVAVKLGRLFLGMDVDKARIQQAAQRLAQA
jgi:hypothetical protein